MALLAAVCYVALHDVCLDAVLEPFLLTSQGHTAYYSSTTNTIVIFFFKP